MRISSRITSIVPLTSSPSFNKAELNKQLNRAVGINDIKTVKALLDKGADVNVKDNSGSTPLIYAARNGRTEVLKALIDKGADVNLKNNYGNTKYKSNFNRNYRRVNTFILYFWCGNPYVKAF